MDLWTFRWRCRKMGPGQNWTALMNQYMNCQLAHSSVSFRAQNILSGSDHRNNLESVKIASICTFEELDLDFYVAARCAPGHGWTNPCERMMSILNIGLQNCTLSRTECSEVAEKLLKPCNSMKSIRKVAMSHPELKEDWASSIEVPQQVVTSRFSRLALKGEPVQVRSPLGEEEVDLLSRHANYLFPEMDLKKLVKVHTQKVLSYTSWLEKHCCQRQYMLQIKKCQDPECCSPPKAEYHWIPDPVLKEDDDEHFQDFESLYGSDTTEEHRPTLKKSNLEQKQNQNRNTRDEPQMPVNIIPADPKLIGAPSLFTAQNARSVVDCLECNKPPVIYSKLKLSKRQEYTLGMLMAEYEYTCGSPLTTPGSSLHGVALVKLNLKCSSPVQNSYYSSSLARPDICYYCAESGASQSAQLKQSYKNVFPVCDNCSQNGLGHPCFRPYGKKK